MINTIDSYLFANTCCQVDSSVNRVAVEKHMASDKDPEQWLKDYKNAIDYASGKNNDPRFKKAFHDGLANEVEEGVIPEATTDCWWKHQFESVGSKFATLKEMEKNRTLGTDFNKEYLAVLKANWPTIKDHAASSGCKTGGASPSPARKVKNCLKSCKSE